MALSQMTGRVVSNIILRLPSSSGWTSCTWMLDSLVDTRVADPFLTSSWFFGCSGVARVIYARGHNTKSAPLAGPTDSGGSVSPQENLEILMFIWFIFEASGIVWKAFTNTNRHPSVSLDDDHHRCVGLHFLVWLCSPILEWKSLPQLSHTSSVLPNTLAFLLALLSVASSILRSSATMMPSFTTVRHVDQSAALHSQSLVRILAAFVSLWQTSWNRRRWRHVFIFPDASSIYRVSLGMRPGIILFKCPAISGDFH